MSSEQIREPERLAPADLKVGDEIRFDHFGGTDRLGRIVKLTKSSVHVEWMAPSSGLVRVVKISTKLRPLHATSEYQGKNVRLAGPRS